MIMKAWFTSTLQRTTKQYKFTLDRKFGILTGTLYIPSLNVELNPINIFKRKIGDFVDTFYPERGNNAIGVMSAFCLSNIENASIDYIFIDPPFGANIMYSELSSSWEGWIKVKTDNTDEAIVNDVQNKTLFEYQDLKVVVVPLKLYYTLIHELGSSPQILDASNLCQRNLLSLSYFCLVLPDNTWVRLQSNTIYNQEFLWFSV